MPRKEDRVTYLKEVVLEFSSGRHTARISDISAGGCYIDSIAQVSVGAGITLHIAATDGSDAELNGRVAYVLEGNGFGVEFTSLADKQKQFLQSILTSSTG
ncbi:MAG: hypothetical protein DMF63_06740 [Acidobacteria bacterium]|nr:MAG: hypothetical protein DMF63_06740 [Acidobacteriota bacterium]